MVAKHKACVHWVWQYHTQVSLMPHRHHIDPDWLGHYIEDWQCLCDWANMITGPPHKQCFRHSHLKNADGK